MVPNINADLVVRLVRDQHPDLAHLAIVEMPGGWDNAIFRLGQELVARLPQRAEAAPLVANELRWLPELAPQLPLAVPVPVRAGVPGHGYPWHWSICRWVPGRPLGDVHSMPKHIGSQLGRFFAALHVPAPADAPVNPYRGVPLRARDSRVREHAAVLDDRDRIVRRWDELAATDAWSGPPVWLHGDLHPRNVLVERGQLSGIVDFGDVTAGDPATDLAIVFMVEGLHDQLVPTPDRSTWRRAQAWALALSLAYVAGAERDPLLGRIGRGTINRIVGTG